MDPRTTETYGLGDPVILEKIDRLFACGVGKLIDLPQIVVVGDQSSGKSSVLEGLIRKPLPRNSELCTRFATRIEFRRSAKESITVSIIADDKVSRDEQKKVEGWKRANVSSLDSATFLSIMDEAHQVMGLRALNETDGRTFSTHVLRLEIAGPDQEHLSVIDVPGIFRNPTRGTKQSDIKLVDDMVLNYMSNSRSVLLVVVPANVDDATQGIVNLAAKVDPEGDRTLGVFTKPDLVDGGAEPRVLALIEDRIEGHAKQMKFGWHVVRNPGQNQLSDPLLDRHALEDEFFQTEPPWRDLSSEKVGTEALRARIKDILSSLVNLEFPNVKLEISERLAKAQRSLEKLGSERSTPQAQGVYLGGIASRFQRLVTLALDAKYGSDEVFDKDPSLRLATLVTTRTEEYSKAMASHGQKFQFSSNEELACETASEEASEPAIQKRSTSRFGSTAPAPTSTTSPFGSAAPASTSTMPRFDFTAPASTSTTSLFGSAAAASTSTVPSFGVKAPFPSSTTPPFPPTAPSPTSSSLSPKIPRISIPTRVIVDDQADLKDILDSQATISEPEADETENWLRKVYDSGRGFELGTFNPTILATAMKEQSFNWVKISLGYISDVITIVHRFIRKALDIVCLDNEVRQALNVKLKTNLLERYQKAISHVNFLLEVERNGTPMTTNHQFNEHLEKRRQSRMIVAMSTSPPSALSLGISKEFEVQNATQSNYVNNPKHTVRDIHDILQAYYQVAVDRYVDNVLTQASHHFLVSGPETPLKLFTANYVIGLKPDELKGIADETPISKKRRAQLEKEIASLTEAKAILDQV